MARVAWTRFLRSALLVPFLSPMLLASAPAHALMFEEQTLDDRLVLWVRDCGKRQGDTCREEQTRFAGRGAYPQERPTRQYSGDAAELERLFAKTRYAEVFLWSGGGDLQEGVAVGRVLRRHQATVRVPKGASCVSACTVAFMGGLFRFVDEGATYEVHAYSGLSRGIPAPLRRELLSGSPQGGLAQYAGLQDRSGREWAHRLLSYFQEMLHGRPHQARLRSWLQQRRPPVAYLTSPVLQDDAERIRREGEAAAQEILMRLERDGMEQAIEELRPLLPELGHRAEHALRMLEAMFSSRITLTASLSQETLLKMGYVTRILQP